MDEPSKRWRDFPAPLCGVFEGLWQEVAALHAKWDLYLDLFSDAAKFDLINRTTPAAFQIIEEALRADMTVCCGRLTDPEATGKKQNLSLFRLVGLLADHCDEQFVGNASNLLEQIDRQFAPISQWRNRRVAHNDLATALSYHPEPLPGIGQERITQGLQMIASLMNSVQLRFEDSTTHYGPGGIRRGTGKDLLYLLEQATEYEEKNRRDEMRAIVGGLAPDPLRDD